MKTNILSVSSLRNKIILKCNTVNNLISKAGISDRLSESDLGLYTPVEKLVSDH